MSTQTHRTKLDQVMALVSSGRNAEAKASLLRLVQQAPRDGRLLGLLVASLAALGEFDTALYYADRAVSLSPGAPGVHANRARIHILARRFEPAITDLRAELAGSPSDLQTRIALSQVLSSANRLDEALAVLDEVGDQSGSLPTLDEARAAVLLALGYADEALAIERRVIPRDPGNPAVAERAANAAIYAMHSTPAEIRDLAARFGRLVSVRMPTARVAFTNVEEPDRRLRVGFLGGDFREHASARFFEPLAGNYDRACLEVRCYMTMDGEDACTRRIRASVDHFEHVDRLRTPDLAARLRKDGLDILIDLSGRTVGHRIECFHHRPAPLQLTWYGQPCTLGLTAIDYRIVDSVTDPVGTEGNNVERLLRLDPCGFCFQPVADLPAVQPPPSQREDSPTRGSITFGSYSNLSKLNAETFGAWTRILHAVPGSRLVLRHTALGAAGVRSDVMQRFAKAGLAGVDQERVQILGPVADSRAMMDEYHRLDIALDTFPYSGMTTTCEALTMGVPVVGLAMDRSVSRYTLDILTNCGLEGYVAGSIDEYVRIAVDLANDPGALAEVRRTSRERMARTVSNAPAFARRFEAGMRQIWRAWCATQATA